MTRPDGRHDSRERVRKFRKLVRLLRTPSFRRGLRLGVAAAIEHEDVSFDHDFASVIDVGAHHGQFALFAHHQFPRAQIFCFEPLPQGQQIILQLLPEPAPVKLFGIALGSSATEGSVMHISGLDDSSSLLPITERCTTAFPGTEEITSVNVTVSRLNDVFRNHSLARPCLLKIDVQGYELEVLQGGDRILQDVDEVLVECSFTELYAGQALAGELIAHLWAAGFDLAGVFELKRDLAGRCLQADLLFKRRTGSSVSQLLSSST